MCVIVHLPAKKTISSALLKACYDTNHDGWGIMAAIDGKLEYAKDTSSFDEFLKVWKEVSPEAERALHFRIRTQGGVNKANCHPFFPEEDIGVMHNGHIDTALIDADMSDTHNFVKYEMTCLLNGWKATNRDFMDDPAFIKLIEKLTGQSKLLVMTKDGRVTKMRESVWSEREGCSFSNNFSFGRVGYSYGSSYGSYGSEWENDYPRSTYNHNKKHSHKKQNEEFEKVAADIRQYTHRHQEDECYKEWNEELNKAYPPEAQTASTTVSTPSNRTLLTLPNHTQTVLDTTPTKKTSFPLTYERTLPRPVDTYKPLSNNVPLSVEVNENNVVSDLYAGNKTDAEGRDFIERKTDEAMQSMLMNEQEYLEQMAEQNRAMDEEGFAAMEDDLNEDETEVEDLSPLTIDEALLMSSEELLDWLESFPLSAHDLIKELLDQVYYVGGKPQSALAASTQDGEEGATPEKLVSNQ